MEDFERRAVEAGDKEEDIEKSRQYLGGDATHSILVKGLDFSLLAARKAELAREREEVNDEELDALLKREEKPKVEGEKPKASDEVFSKGVSLKQKSLVLRAIDRSFVRSMPILRSLPRRRRK